MTPGRRAIAVLLLAVALVAATAAAALAASPSPSAAGGDVRTEPSPPGVVGDPLFAVVGVVAIALMALGITLLAARVTARR